MKRIMTTFQLSDRNESYLNRIGLIDQRARRIKMQNTSEFINRCITRALETGCHNIQNITQRELTMAYLRFQAGKLNTQVDELNGQLLQISQKLAELRGEEEKEA